jgi:glycosyltransferase involved in cell wall biosynthesis
MSQKVEDDLKKFLTDKPVRRVEHPLYDNFGAMVSIPEARQHLGLPADGRLILFFGFIRAYKGLDMLLHAMAREPLRSMDIKLLVAGEFYQDSKPYLELIHTLGISSSVILHDKFIPDADVKYFCCAADFIIQPYRNATQSGVTPLAYHFEVPMVVTNVGGLPAMVQQGLTGVVVEPNEASIASGIAEAYRHGREHFVPSIREAKKKYSWQALTSAILQTAYENHQ